MDSTSKAVKKEEKAAHETKKVAKQAVLLMILAVALAICSAYLGAQFALNFYDHPQIIPSFYQIDWPPKPCPFC